MTAVKNDTSNREMIITRLINAPRELVWKAWTTPEHVKHWWGPDGFTNTIHEMDVKPGGVWRFMMHGPDGTDYPNKIIFKEVIKPERLAYTHCTDDENESNLFHSVVTFEDQGGKTYITMRALFTSAEEKERIETEFGALEGGKQTLRRLQEYIPAMENAPVIVERTYNAPVERVWKAITDRDQMKQWYFDIAEFKPEPGFEFRFTGENKEGRKYFHLCKVIDVVPNKKLSYSWRYEGFEGNSFVTFELFKEGEKTRVKLTHKGLETFPIHNGDFAKSNFEEGWTSIIGMSLRKFTESQNKY